MEELSYQNCRRREIICAVAGFSDAKQLELMWESDARWSGVERSYGGDDVVRLRGSVNIDYTLARLGAERLWKLLGTEPYVPALGCMTGAIRHPLD